MARNFIFEEEVSLRGQSRQTSDGLQDELDVRVLVLHLGLHNRPFLERGSGEDFNLLFFCDCWLSELLCFDKLSAKKRRALRLLVPKNALGLAKRRHFQTPTEDPPSSCTGFPKRSHV